MVVSVIDHCGHPRGWDRCAEYVRETSNVVGPHIIAVYQGFVIICLDKAGLLGESMQGLRQDIVSW